MAKKQSKKKRLPKSLEWSGKRKASAAEERKIRRQELDWKSKRKFHSDESLDTTKIKVWEPDPSRCERFELSRQATKPEDDERTKAMKARHPFNEKKSNPFYKQLKRGWEAKIKAMVASEIRNEEIQAKADHHAVRSQERHADSQFLRQRTKSGQLKLSHMSPLLLARITRGTYVYRC